MIYSIYLSFLTDLTNESSDSAGAIAINDLKNPVYDTESVKMKDLTGAINNLDTSEGNKATTSNPSNNMYSQPTAKSNGTPPKAKPKGNEHVFQNTIYGHDMIRNEYSKTSAEGDAAANNARAAASGHHQTDWLASTGGVADSALTEDHYDTADVAIPGPYEIPSMGITGGQLDSQHDVALPSSDLYDMPKLPNGQYEVAHPPNSGRYDVIHVSSEKQTNLPAGEYDVVHLPSDTYDVAHVPSEHVQTGPSDDYDVAHPPGTQQQYDDVVMQNSGNRSAVARQQQPGGRYDYIDMSTPVNQHSVTHPAPPPGNAHAQFDDGRYDMAHLPPPDGSRPVQYDDTLVQPPDDQYDVAHVSLPPPSNKQLQFDDGQYDVAHPPASNRPVQYDDLVTNGLYDVAHAPPPAAAGTMYEMVDAPTSRSSSTGMNHLNENSRYESLDLQDMNNTYSVADDH